MDALREDVAPTWLAEPLSLEETAERYVRPGLRNVFVDLCRQPVSHYLDRWGLGVRPALHAWLPFRSHSCLYI
jgi:hypothetical protein